MKSYSKIFSIKSDTEFLKFCMYAFDYQINNNPIYSEYAKYILKERIPKNIAEIPFLPIEFFKKKSIICDKKDVERKFFSSGTEGEKSTHYISDLSLYEQSFNTAFNKFYGDISDYCILALLPTYQENKNSSLMYMINSLIYQTKNPNSGFHMYDFKKLADIINSAEKNGQKTILFGVTYALLDFAKAYPMQLNNTIIMETGGMKGKRKELLKDEVHEILKKAFSLKKIHSEYGMTELLSQAYSYGNNIFNTPNWMRILIRDVNDPFSIIKNKTGGVNIIDLANIYSCPFIATQDLGKSYDDNSFSILGRYSNADIRGCNLLIQ